MGRRSDSLAAPAVAIPPAAAATSRCSEGRPGRSDRSSRTRVPSYPPSFRPAPWRRPFSPRASPPAFLPHSRASRSSPSSARSTVLFVTCFSFLLYFLCSLFFFFYFFFFFFF